MSTLSNDETEEGEIQNQDYSHIIETMNTDADDLLNTDWTTKYDLPYNNDSVDIFVTSPLQPETQEAKQPKIIPSSDPNIMIANDEYYKGKKQVRRILSTRKDKSKRTINKEINSVPKHWKEFIAWKELIPCDTKTIPHESTNNNQEDPRKLIKNTHKSISTETDSTTDTHISKNITITVTPQTEQQLSKITTGKEIEQTRKRKSQQLKHPEDTLNRNKYYRLRAPWNIFKIAGGHIDRFNGHFRYVLKNCQDTGFRIQATESQFESIENTQLTTPRIVTISAQTQTTIEQPIISSESLKQAESKIEILLHEIIDKDKKIIQLSQGIVSAQQSGKHFFELCTLTKYQTKMAKLEVFALKELNTENQLRLKICEDQRLMNIVNTPEQVIKMINQYRTRQQHRIRAIKELEQNNPQLTKLSVQAILNIQSDNLISPLILSNYPNHTPTLSGQCHSLEGIGLPEGYITEIDQIPQAHKNWNK